MWIFKVIIVIMFATIMVPIEKRIYRTVNNRLDAWLDTYLIATVIMLCGYLVYTSLIVN